MRAANPQSFASVEVLPKASYRTVICAALDFAFAAEAPIAAAKAASVASHETIRRAIVSSLDRFESTPKGSVAKPAGSFPPSVDQSAMSRVAGGFLGATPAGVGVASAAPDLTDDVELGSSDLFGREPSAAVLRGEASAGRDRGKGGVFRSTCGIGIGGTNLSSLCAAGVAGDVKNVGAGDGTSGAARAWPNIATDASRQRQNLMVGNAITPTLSAPAQDEMAGRFAVDCDNLWGDMTAWRHGTLRNYLLRCGDRAR
jgi:hypothetical protein